MPDYSKVPSRNSGGLQSSRRTAICSSPISGNEADEELPFLLPIHVTRRAFIDIDVHIYHLRGKQQVDSSTTRELQMEMTRVQGRSRK